MADEVFQRGGRLARPLARKRPAIFPAPAPGLKLNLRQVTEVTLLASTQTVRIGLRRGLHLATGGAGIAWHRGLQRKTEAI